MGSMINAPVIWNPSIARLYPNGGRGAQRLARSARPIPDSDSVQSAGARLHRGRNGRARFNFSQIVFLYPGVQMDWTSRLSREAETLAANILIRFLPCRGPYVYLCPDCLLGQLSRYDGLAWQFAKQVLVTLPTEGSELEPDFLRGWLEAHLRILHLHRTREPHGSSSTRIQGLPRRAWMRPGEVVE